MVVLPVEFQQFGFEVLANLGHGVPQEVPYPVCDDATAVFGGKD